MNRSFRIAILSIVLASLVVIVASLLDGTPAYLVGGAITFVGLVFGLPLALQNPGTGSLGAAGQG